MDCKCSLPSSNHIEHYWIYRYIHKHYTQTFKERQVINSVTKIEIENKQKETSDVPQMIVQRERELIL